MRPGWISERFDDRRRDGGRCVGGECEGWRGERERANLFNLPALEATDRAVGQAEHDADRKYGECQAINLEAGTDLPFGAPLPLAVARDGSDYMAQLYTQAAFGCAMWSEHNESPAQPSAKEN
jgi:hypothetical protein